MFVTSVTSSHANGPEFLSLALYSLDLLELSARPRADRSIRLGQASGSPWSVFVSLCIRTATRPRLGLHPRRHPPLFSITVFCELPSARPARIYLFSPIYSLMIGRLMTFLGLGLLATIVPPNKPKCVLGIILSRPSGVERPPS